MILILWSKWTDFTPLGADLIEGLSRVRDGGFGGDGREE